MAQEEEIGPAPQVGETWKISGRHYLIEDIYHNTEKDRKEARLRDLEIDQVYDWYDYKLFKSKLGYIDDGYLWTQVLGEDTQEIEAKSETKPEPIRETIEI